MSATTFVTVYLHGPGWGKERVRRGRKRSRKRSVRDGLRGERGMLKCSSGGKYFSPLSEWRPPPSLSVHGEEICT